MTLFYKLSVLMGVVVVASNYLVQFPIQYFGLNEILTYGAFSYPITFLISDLANRAYGKVVARKIVYLGFAIGIFLTVFLDEHNGDATAWTTWWSITTGCLRKADDSTGSRIPKESWVSASLVIFQRQHYFT